MAGIRQEYGSGGFYFQQRRSKVDLRAVSKLDLQRIVREVDVDALQDQLENVVFGQLTEDDLRFMTDAHVIKLFRVSQLTIEYLLYAQEQLTGSLHSLATKYAEKKRSLQQKRQEVNALADGNKQLKHQLRLKKKGVGQLEALLKENARNGTTGGAQSLADAVAVAKEKERLVAEAARARPPPRVLQYFVTGPDGICIELQSPSSMLVFDVVSDVRRTFISRKAGPFGDNGSEDSCSGSEGESESDGSNRSKGSGANGARRRHGALNVVLMSRGKQLLEESSLAESGVRDGDSLVAVVKDKEGRDGKRRKRAHRRRQEKTPASPAQPSPAVLQMLEKQQETLRVLAEELRAEQVKRQQLHDLMEQQRRDGDMAPTSPAPAVRRVGVSAGDLESDEEEDLVLSRQELAGKLRRSNGKIAALQSQLRDTERSLHQFEYAVSVQHLDMELLRKQVYSGQGQQPVIVQHISQPPIATQAPAPAPAPAPVEQAPAEVPVVTVRAQKRKPDSPPAAVRPAPAPAPATMPVREPTPPVIEAPVVVEAPIEAAKPPPEPKPEPEPEPTDTTTVIVFEADLNPDLSTRLQGRVAAGDDGSVALSVPNDAGLDDLVFEMRSAVAEKLEVPLAQVVLQLSNAPTNPSAGSAAVGSLPLPSASGRPLLITLGVDAAKRPFTAPQAAAMAATGELRVRVVNALSDAQMDALVSKYERQGGGGRKPSGVGARHAGGAGGARDATKRLVELLSDSSAEEDLIRRGRGAAVGRGGTAGVGFADDDSADASVGDLRAMMRSRESLDETIRSLSDREGLTDEELTQERRKLSKTAAALPKSVSGHVSGHKTTVVASVQEAAALAEAENIVRSGNDSGVSDDDSYGDRYGAEEARFSRSGGVLNSGAATGGMSGIKVSKAAAASAAKSAQQRQQRQQLFSSNTAALQRPKTSTGRPAPIGAGSVAAAAAASASASAVLQQSVGGADADDASADADNDGSFRMHSAAELEWTRGSAADRARASGEDDSPLCATATISATAAATAVGAASGAQDGVRASEGSNGSSVARGRYADSEADYDSEAEEQGQGPSTNDWVAPKLPAGKPSPPNESGRVDSRVVLGSAAAASASSSSSSSGGSEMFARDSLNDSGDFHAPQGRQPAVAAAATATAASSDSRDDTNGVHSFSGMVSSASSGQLDGSDMSDAGHVMFFNNTGGGGGGAAVVRSGARPTAESRDSASKFNDSTLNSTASFDYKNIGNNNNAGANSRFNRDSAESNRDSEQWRGSYDSTGSADDSRVEPQQGPDQDQDSSTASSLLNTAELLKYAGIDLSRTVDTNVSGVGSSVQSSGAEPPRRQRSPSYSGEGGMGVHRSASAGRLTDHVKDRERILQRADIYEGEAAIANAAREAANTMSSTSADASDGSLSPPRTQLSSRGSVGNGLGGAVSPKSSLFNNSAEESEDDGEPEEGDEHASDHKQSHGQGQGQDRLDHDGKAAPSGNNLPSGSANRSMQGGPANSSGISNISNVLSTPQGKGPGGAGAVSGAGVGASPFMLTPAMGSPFDSLGRGGAGGQRSSAGVGGMGAMGTGADLEHSYSSDYDGPPVHLSSNDRGHGPGHRSASKYRGTVAGFGGGGGDGHHHHMQVPGSASSVGSRGDGGGGHPHGLHGGDSLALSESGDMFGEMLEDSTATTHSTSAYFASNTNTNTHSSATAGGANTGPSASAGSNNSSTSSSGGGGGNAPLRKAK